jgi:hypothetical protein
MTRSSSTLARGAISLSSSCGVPGVAGESGVRGLSSGACPPRESERTVKSAAEAHLGYGRLQLRGDGKPLGAELAHDLLLLRGVPTK